MIRSRQRYGCLGILLLVSSMAVGQAQAPAGPIDPGEIEKLLKQFNVPGVSIAVIKDFKVEWARGYGLADADAGTPVTADTMFQAASTTRQRPALRRRCE